MMSEVAFDADVTYKENSFTVLGETIKIWDGTNSMTSPAVAHELNEGDYYLEEVKKLGKITPGSIILDLGTNVGITAIILAKLFPSASVIGVEALPYNYVAALKNVRLNDVHDRVTIVCGALTSDTTKPLPMQFSIKNPGSSTGSADFYSHGSDNSKGKREMDIWGITVDEIISHFSIKKVAFIKLDCEGCEYDVIPSLSANALKIFKDALVFGETHCDRMKVDPAVIEYVHDIYNGFSQTNPKWKQPTCGKDGAIKKWVPS